MLLFVGRSFFPCGPSTSQLAFTKFPPGGQTLFMAGGEEFFVKSGHFMRRVRTVHQQAPGTEGFVVPGAGHFFLLTQPDVTMKRLREFLEPQ